MQVTVTGKDYEVSEGLREHLDSELNKLQRFYDPILDCRVTIEKEDRSKKVNIVVHVHGQMLKAASDAENVHAAIDGAVAKVTRQLKRLQEKRSDHRPRQETQKPRDEDEENE